MVFGNIGSFPVAALSNDDHEFIADLEDLIDRAVAQGVSVDLITASLQQHGADLVTAVWARVIDLMIKFWIVVFCSLTPATIWGWKFYASITEKHFADDQWLNIVCLISLLAVVSQFFNLRAVLPVIDRFIKAMKK